MRKKLLLLVITSLFLLSLVLTGCQSGGIAEETYDKLKAQYDEIAEKYQEAADEIGDIQQELPDIADELEAAVAENDELQAVIDELTDKYELVGDTPAETAAKIVKYYHETHIYDRADMFVCADMAAEVWNMLKAQGINALIMVGNLNAPIMEITQCDHSWVLAEVAPGEYLALETTGGIVVPRSENAQYYRGWNFETPAAEKDWQRLAREFNTRVEIVNSLNNEINTVIAEYNDGVNTYNEMIGGGYSSAQIKTQEELIDQLRAIKDKLIEIKESMEEKLYNIQDQMEGLATPML